MKTQMLVLTPVLGLLIVFNCLLPLSLQAVRASAPVKAVATPMAQKKTRQLYHWFNHVEWASELWTGNNDPYQTARVHINNVLSAQPTSGSVLLAKFRSAAKAHPTSPITQFRWAYLSLRLAPTPRFVGEDGLDEVRNAFAYPPSPHAYDYTRLRFLLHQHSSADQRLISLGARLLKRNPHDLSVQYSYVASLRNSSKPSVRQLALVESQRLVQEHPKEATPYALLGSVYLARWVDDKVANRPKKVDADLCIAAYQQYLSHAPSNDGFRKSALDVIQWVQTR